MADSWMQGSWKKTGGPPPFFSLRECVDGCCPWASPLDPSFFSLCFLGLEIERRVLNILGQHATPNLYPQIFFLLYFYFETVFHGVTQTGWPSCLNPLNSWDYKSAPQNPDILQHGLNSNDSPASSRAFSAGLGLQRPPALWTDGLLHPRPLQHAHSHRWTTWPLLCKPIQ